MPHSRSGTSGLYDQTVKALLRRYPAELGLWLTGERPTTARQCDPVLPVVQSRLVDKLLDLTFADRRPLLVHVEFQTASSPEMPRRMAQYVTLLLGVLEEPEHVSKDFASVVVYLDPKAYRHDPGKLELSGALGLELSFSYRVVRLWEVDPGPLLALESPALCPLVPLMAGKPRELLLQSREKIIRAPQELVSAEAKRDLLTIQVVLAARVVDDAGLLSRIYAEIRTMGENYILDLAREEGIAIGREEGRESGARNEARRAVLRVLTRRFPEAVREVSGELTRKLDAIEDLEKLETLLEGAAVAPDLATFASEIEGDRGAGAGALQ